MVHTAEANLYLSITNIVYLNNRYGIAVKGMTQRDLNRNFLGITFRVVNFTYNSKGNLVHTLWRMDIHFDFIIMLNTAAISDADVPTIIKKINEFLSYIYPPLDVEDLVLKRIDYCLNVKVPLAYRQMYLQLLAKAKNKSCYMLNTNFFKKKGSDYFKSKSKETIVYDKEKERKDKHQNIEWYDKDIIRFEARLKPQHLYYQKYKNKLERALPLYLNQEKSYEYMQNMIVKTYYLGDYYSLAEAKKLINASPQVSNKDKSPLVEFLKFISVKRSISKAATNMSGTKLERYINLLTTIDVNPIVIPKHYGIKHMTNPLKQFKMP